MPGVRITEGQWDFSGGVDSGKVATLASELIPNGLKRNQVAWLNNGTVRGGGILQRTGWSFLSTVHDSTAIFQGGWLYDASALGQNPYLVLLIGGHVYRALVEPPFTIVDLSASFGVFLPATEPKAYFCQGEEFLVIQSGDNVTLPLFWDGVTLRQSVGIISANNVPGIAPLGVLPYNELPAGTAMDYYMGRFWVANQRQFLGGDIVQNRASGTAPYNYRDSILKVTECPLAIGGDAFSVGSDAGDIRAIAHAATLDSVLGDGPLFIFTRKVVYKFTVPTTRSDWTSVSAANLPTMTLAQKRKGTYSDRSVVSMSGDLFYQSPDGIRSLMMAIRYFYTWGNTPISNNEQRILQFNDRSMMRFSSGMEFDNRLWQTALPVQTPVGVAFQAIIPLDFDLVTSLGDKLPPAWEGMYEGLLPMQLFEGDFGGRDRAFAVVVSEVTGNIDIWEFSDALRFDEGDRRVQMVTEFPGYTWHDHFPGSAGEVELKELAGGEIWIDKVYGTVEMQVFYRVDSDPCWRPWFQTTFCAARSTCEDVNNPVCYPDQPYQDYREGYKFAITLPRPPSPDCVGMTGRPSTIGYVFQTKVVTKGWMRIRGHILHAEKRDKADYDGLNC